MRNVLLLLLLLPLFVNAQKIERNETDDFTGNQVLYTNWERIHWGMKAGNGKQFITRFGLENGVAFLGFNWVADKVLAVNKDATIMFKLANGDVHELYSANYAVSNVGEATVSAMWGSTKSLGFSLVYNGDLSFFSKSPVTKLRIQTTDGYVDIDIKEKEGEKLTKQYSVFTGAIR